jgi:hypothetical protein
MNSEPSATNHQPSAINHSARKSRSRFALLPQPLREQLNRRLDDGCQYEEIRAWLFAQTADRDIPALNLKAGEPYALAWTRSTPDEHKLIRNFGVALSAWYHSHFQHWRDEQSKRKREGWLRVVQSADDIVASVGNALAVPRRHHRRPARHQLPPPRCLGQNLQHR